MKTRIEALQEAAIENGVLNIDKYTELVVGDSVAPVLDYKQKHFDNDWLVKNYIQKSD